MKTRVIRTSIWRDTLDQPMNIDTKVLYFYLLTNEHVGLTDYQKISLREVSFYSGLNEKQILSCLSQLEDAGFIKYSDGWVRLIVAGAYVQSHFSGPNVELAREKEISEIPLETKNILDGVGVPNGYPKGTQQVSINNKEEIISNKLKVIKNKYGELGNVKLSDKEHQKLVERIGEKNTEVMIFKLDTYIASKGRKYKSHYATILSWVAKEGQDNLKNKQIDIAQI